MEANVVLVGLGPHAKRIYMNCFKKNQFAPLLVIDIEAKRNEIEQYLKENKLNTEVYYIKEINRDKRELVEEDRKNIQTLIKRLGITHSIISTEPKAHYSYIRFFLKNNVHILVDKPLTAIEDVTTDIKMAKKLKEDYDEIKKMCEEAKKQNTFLQVQCQRRWHKGYLYTHELVTNIVKEYNIPITSIQVMHCDGMWNMPSEFIERENHPYKYGYGKLFHSGYHFIDLVAWFEEINNNLLDKKPEQVELFTSAVRPNDFMHVINKDDYKNLFKTNKFDDIFKRAEEYDFNKYGEIDLYSIIQFKRNNKVISTANISLIQNGFSRRSWAELPEDTYKSNGRVRHEYMNIEIGPLMNIQIHSYQSKEIKDREIGKTGIGDVEHFNIYIFRNIDLIGGELLQKYTLDDLYNHKEIMLGYNEAAREKCFRDFIEENAQESTIEKHELGIKLLSKICESMCIKHEGKSGYVEFDIQEETI